VGAAIRAIIALVRLPAAALFVLCLMAACKRPSPAGAPPDGSAVIRIGATARQHGQPAAPLPLPPARARADDPPEAVQARHQLVKQIESFDRPWGDDGEWDPRVLSALRAVPRHLFMPGVPLSVAYGDYPYDIGYEQTISQPTVVALMTNALKLSGRERVLEIGTGSGYQAAVLSPLAQHVYSIEIVEPLGLAAKQRLARLGYTNVTVRIGDGYQGWPEQAPFDRIILTAAPKEMPAALVSQLRAGGIIVAPIGDVYQELVRWTKQGDGLVKQQLGGVRFVPMVPATP